jgi:SAM-dependent methyltransferase
MQEGADIDRLANGHSEGEVPAITPATWDYITSRRIAGGYDRDYCYSELFRFDTEVLDRWLPEPGRLLDLGCGTGRHVVHFAERGFDVTGVDLSEHMLAAARRKLAERGCGATLVHGDITRLAELGLGRFDCAISMFSVLGMIYGAENRLRFLRSVLECLEDGGLFAFHVHNRWYNLRYRDGRQYLWRALRDRWRGRPEAFQKDVDGYHGIRRLSLYVFSAREVRKLVAGAGFRLQEVICLNAARNAELRGVARGMRCNGFLVACRGGRGQMP